MPRRSAHLEVIPDVVRLSVCAVFLLTVALAAFAQDAATPTTTEQSVNPGINENYKRGTEPVEQWIDRFERESREIFAQRAKIVEVMGLKKGQAVADIGAGTGLFTLLFGREVGPDGKVYAVDISKDFIELINERAAKAGMDQVETVLCKEDSAELPDESVDAVFICDTYHHFEYPMSTLASIHRALRPGGTMVVIDFHRIEGESSEWTLNHVRAGQEVFKREIIEAGFEWIDDGPEQPFLEDNYIMRFRKPAE